MDWTTNLGWLGDAPTEQVAVRGNTLTVRLLTGAQIDKLYELYPEPIAPMGKDPGAGGKSSNRVQRVDDPMYVQRRNQAHRDRGYAKISLMTSDNPLVRADGTLTLTGLEPTRQEFAKHAHAIGQLSDAERDLLVQAHERIVARVTGSEQSEQGGQGEQEPPSPSEP